MTESPQQPDESGESSEQDEPLTDREEGGPTADEAAEGHGEGAKGTRESGFDAHE